MSNKITTRQAKKRRVAERDHPLWELVVNNDDISLTHIVPKLNVTDVKFLYETNKASRALIKRAPREIKSHIRKKFRIEEMSSISTLECAWEKRPPWLKDETDFCTKVAETNKLELLKWIREEKKCKWDGWTMSSAASQGNLEMIKYCVANECPVDERACTCAARNGHLEVLKYLREEVKAPVNGKVIKIAACHGDLELIRYLVENKCAGWENGYLDALDIIAKHGHFQCLKYLHEEIKVPFDQDDEDSTMDLALRGGSTNVEMFKYLIENNCPIEIPYMICSSLIHYQSSHHHGGRKPKGRCNFMLLECLKYLHEEAKMPLTEDTMIEAAGFGEIEIMRYLVEKKCPISSDGRALSRAAEDGDLESVKYLYEIGTPVNINAQRWLSKWGYTPDDVFGRDFRKH